MKQLKDSWRWLKWWFVERRRVRVSPNLASALSSLRENSSPGQAPTPTDARGLNPKRGPPLTELRVVCSCGGTLAIFKTGPEVLPTTTPEPRRGGAMGWWKSRASAGTDFSDNEQDR